MVFPRQHASLRDVSDNTEIVTRVMVLLSPFTDAHTHRHPQEAIVFIS